MKNHEPIPRDLSAIMSAVVRRGETKVKARQWRAAAEPLNHARLSFTLVEVLIATAIFAIVVGGTVTSFWACQKMWNKTNLGLQTAKQTSFAIQRMVYGVGTNPGLRAARDVGINTNRTGFWTMSAVYPPGAQDNSHYLGSGTPDGSWRLTITNSNGTNNLLDYNKNASNIVYWEKVAFASRLPIAHSISAASVTKTNNGLLISITAFTTWGDMRVTNVSSTFVAFRN